MSLEPHAFGGRFPAQCTVASPTPFRELPVAQVLSQLKGYKRVPNSFPPIPAKIVRSLFPGAASTPAHTPTPTASAAPTTKKAPANEKLRKQEENAAIMARAEEKRRKQAADTYVAPPTGTPPPHGPGSVQFRLRGLSAALKSHPPEDFRFMQQHQKLVADIDEVIESFAAVKGQGEPFSLSKIRVVKADGTEVLINKVNALQTEPPFDPETGVPVDRRYQFKRVIDFIMQAMAIHGENHRIAPNCSFLWEALSLRMFRGSVRALSTNAVMESRAAVFDAGRSAKLTRSIMDCMDQVVDYRVDDDGIQHYDVRASARARQQPPSLARAERIGGAGERANSLLFLRVRSGREERAGERADNLLLLRVRSGREERAGGAGECANNLLL
jgi:hypothetical protein